MPALETVLIGGEISPEKLLKYDGAVPRYTSYPPANFFTEDPEAIDFRDLLAASNRAGPRNLSFYLHVPFCPRRCLFCGCNTEIGRSGAFVREYMDLLPREFRLLLPYLDRSRPVTQIHFGGGTPNAVSYSGLDAMLRAIAAEFRLSPGAEIAIECDPALILPAKLEDLSAMGFNRVSFGIQDTNPRVREAVHRSAPRMPLPELVRSSRALGFFGINLDLIYGLPYQTPETFRSTVADIVDADPDRVSLFPYAHVPWVKGHQSKLERFPMPDAMTRLHMAAESRRAFLRAGYVAIGMDHFAKPDDELSRAKTEGALHRNFQGYCVQTRAGQVHALGASGITQLHQGYLQNEKDTDRYRARVLAGELPFASGYRMAPEDIAVRSIVNGLLCSGSAEVETALDAADLDPDWKARYRVECADKLAPFALDGFVSWENGMVAIAEEAVPLARVIAAAFDPRQKASVGKQEYSRAL